jgi:hypothetical protein
MTKTEPSKAFIDYLVNEVPKFDEEIIKSIRFSVHPLRIDARLLPPKERNKWLRASGHLGKKWRFKGAAALRHKLYDLLDEWLEALPKRKQEKERAKRSGWIGRITTGRIPMGTPVEITQDRFKSVWPKTTKPWTKEVK